MVAVNASQHSELLAYSSVAMAYKGALTNFVWKAVQSHTLCFSH